MEDPKWNYHLQVVEYLDDYCYRRLEPRPGPSAGTRAANFIANHEFEPVHGVAAAVYLYDIIM